MAWLVAAALVLAVAAGLCASAEVAVIRASRAGARELRREGGRPPWRRLQAVLAEPSRYLSVLLLARMGSETAAVVLMTAALVHWVGTGWHTFLIAVAVMTAVLYVVAGLWPRTLGRRFDRQLASAAASIFYPAVPALGPAPP